MTTQAETTIELIHAPDTTASVRTDETAESLLTYILEKHYTAPGEKFDISTIVRPTDTVDQRELTRRRLLLTRRVHYDMQLSRKDAEKKGPQESRESRWAWVQEATAEARQTGEGQELSLEAAQFETKMRLSEMTKWDDELEEAKLGMRDSSVRATPLGLGLAAATLALSAGYMLWRSSRDDSVRSDA